MSHNYSMDDMFPDLLGLARAAGVTVTTAESCTGGMIAAAITDVPGASEMFDRGFVTYSNAAKVQILGVSEETLATYGAVSEQVAREMAMGALDRSVADLAVSVTGIAGPGGATADKPEGMVCFALAGRGSDSFTETIRFGPLGRAQVRAATVRHALSLLTDALRTD